MPKTIKKDEKLFLNINILKKKDIAFIFKITPRAVYSWTKTGCPRNKDESYNLRDVIEWRESQSSITTPEEEKYGVELQKLRNQNRKLELEIEDKEAKTISKDKFKEIQQRQSDALMNYLTDGFKRNSQELYSEIKKTKSVKSFLEVFDGFIKFAMDRFVEGGVDI